MWPAAVFLVHSESEFPATSSMREICREAETIQHRADRCSPEQAEGGVPLAEVIQRVGISEQTFYGWKKQYVRLEVDQVRQLKPLREENRTMRRDS